MRAVQSEEELALVKDRGLRRVQVFRLCVPERTPAERDDAPALVRNRDHNAPPKAVVDPVAALAFHGKPRRHEEVFGDASLLERIGEL